MSLLVQGTGLVLCERLLGGLFFRREVAGNDPIHPAHDQLRGRVVVLLESIGPRIGDVSVVQLADVSALFDELFDHAAFRSNDQIVLVEVEVAGPALLMAGKVDADPFSVKDSEFGGRTAFASDVEDTSTFDVDAFEAGVLEEHVENMCHERAPVAIAEAAAQYGFGV
jgi:hypothetical protein